MMSHFCNYDDTSNNYDNGRQAAGVDVMVALIKAHSKIDYKELHVLDAGCGTGNYALALLDSGIQNITMIDGSNGMLLQARKKIETRHSNKAEIKHAILPRIPYPDHTFDVVMINQVVHHLDKNADGEHYPMIESCLTETNRVLKPEGLLVMTVSPRENLNGLWYMHLNEACHQRYSLKIPRGKTYLDMIRRSRFNVINFLGILGHSDAPSNYTDLEGPLHKSYRDTDSFWSIFSDKEISETLDYVRVLKNNDKLKEFYEKHDKLVEKGYFDVITARKY